jgi:hypothetical protein
MPAMKKWSAPFEMKKAPSDVRRLHRRVTCYLRSKFPDGSYPRIGYIAKDDSTVIPELEMLIELSADVRYVVASLSQDGEDYEADAEHLLFNLEHFVRISAFFWMANIDHLSLRIAAAKAHVSDLLAQSQIDDHGVTLADIRLARISNNCLSDYQFEARLNMLGPDFAPATEMFSFDSDRPESDLIEELTSAMLQNRRAMRVRDILRSQDATGVVDLTTLRMLRATIGIKRGLQALAADGKIHIDYVGNIYFLFGKTILECSAGDGQIQYRGQRITAYDVGIPATFVDGLRGRKVRCAIDHVWLSKLTRIVGADSWACATDNSTTLHLEVTEHRFLFNGSTGKFWRSPITGLAVRAMPTR